MNAAEPRLQRVARPLRMAVLGTVVVALLVAAFVAGRFFAPPAQDAVKSAAQVIDVWATARMAVVSPASSFAGTVKEGSSVVVTARAMEEPAVVTRSPLKANERVPGGALVVAISGKPYFALEGRLALYRDLVAGDRGDDVVTLQEALAAGGARTRTDGVVDWRTLQAVAKMFGDEGFPMPSREKQGSGSGAQAVPGKQGGVPAEPQPTPERERVIPFRQLLGIPTSGGKVQSVLKVGDVPTAGDPLLTLRTSDEFAEFTADVGELASLKVGQKVAVRGEGKSLEGTITSLGDFIAGKDGERSGNKVSVALDAPQQARGMAGQSVTVTLGGSADAPEVLAVPTTALRQDSQGSFVLVQVAGGAERRVGVVPGASDAGLTAIEGEPRAGDKVKVS